MHDGGVQPHEHIPTPETREFVRIAVAAKMPRKQIQARLGISTDITYYKRYSTEIAEGRCLIPHLAALKLAQYLQTPAADTAEARDQAQLAARVLERHGWKDDNEGRVNITLPNLVIQRAPEHPDDK